MGHYSPAQKHAELASYAREAVDYLLRKFPVLGANVRTDHRPYAEGYPLLIYRGMSGVACATAVAQEMWRREGISLPMMYVRKPDEKSHSDYAVEAEIDSIHKRGMASPIMFVPVLADDFVASGDTARAVLAAAFEEVQLNLCTYHLLQASRHYGFRAPDGNRFATKAMLKIWGEDARKKKQAALKAEQDSEVAY